jgi:hypothetical protein
VSIQGKLNVGGLIDPIGLVLNPQSSQPTGYTGGALWVDSSLNSRYQSNYVISGVDSNAGPLYGPDAPYIPIQTSDEEFNTYPLPAKWTVVNDVSYSIQDSTLVMNKTTMDASFNPRLVVQDACLNQWRYRAKIGGKIAETATVVSGIVVGNSSNNRYIIFGRGYDSANRLSVVEFDLSSINLFSNAVSVPTVTDMYPDQYYEVENNGNWLFFRQSFTGAKNTFYTIATRQLSSYMSNANRIGFGYITSNDLGYGMVHSLSAHWLRRDASFAAASDPQFPVASGGTETTYSSGGLNYKVHTFTSNSVWTLTSYPITATFDMLCVGGGASGGIGRGGGGGAGQVRYGTVSNIGTGYYNITIGSGGAAVVVNDGSGNIGQPSRIDLSGGSSLFIAIGGGPGSGWTTSNGYNGGSGGGARGSSGATGGSNVNTLAGITGTGGTAYGNVGGNPSANTGGGGGGAGAAGVTGTGGNGVQINANGTLTYYGGGGGGGSASGSSTVSAGGLGGGGKGYFTSGSNPADMRATANTGGGGGGNEGPSGPSGAGGSGIVIIRYQIA